MSETNPMLPELAAWMMLTVLAVVLLVGFLFMALVLHLSRKRRSEGTLLQTTGRSGSDPSLLELHRAYLHLPPRWVAIRSTNPTEVQNALSVVNPTPCSLSEGLTESKEMNLFISPPIRGWILVTGNDLPDPEDDVDCCHAWLCRLSGKLGEVQFFSANRALNHHAWARLLSGEVFRAYAWAGETLWNQGEITRAELDLKMECHRYGEGDLVDYFRQSNNNAEKVALLASRWSLDPATIDIERHWPRPGIAGELNQS